jgi:alkylation response protein AidB-like acyl-CoA dehydrogenase
MADRLDALTRVLAAHAHAYDASGEWPQACLDAYAAAGGWSWSVPRAHGGAGLSARERLRAYMALARGDMSTALFITQHDGAVDLLVDSDNAALRREYLPRYARGEGLTTIGYSQLTTSRQGGPPALVAEPSGDGWHLRGVLPWVTGADHVESVMAGAVQPDGQQVILLLRFEMPGVVIEPPLRLLALDSSHTSLVRCTDAMVPARFLVAGPTERVLARRSAVRALLVSATGIGLLGAMADALAALAPGSLPDGAVRADALAAQAEALAERLDSLAAQEPPPAEPVDALRAEVNDLLVRWGAALLVHGKGTGYLRDSLPQRLAREALFFCVWSAPDGIRRQTLERLLGKPG